MLIKNEEKNWGMACHLAALSMYIGVPFGNILGPLIVWMIKKNESPFVDEQGKESLNFQISMSLYLLLCLPLVFLLIGIPLLVVLGIMHLILTIVGTVRSGGGEHYRYPLTIRFFG
jgi:uncharacterized Tic20 family protein